MKAPLLEIAGLAVRYAVRGRGRGGRPRWFTALDDVDLVLHAGRSLGVVGESGSGKSTLARAILALVEPCAGEIRWQGVPVRPGDRAGLRRMRRELQPVFQDPFGSLDPRMTVGESVAEALQALEGVAGAPAVRARVQASLEEVGLDAALSRRYPHELSGGQCQRAAIARATVARPKLLVCDEAVSALDVSIQAQIVNLLYDLSQRHGMALLFISHNLAVVHHLCDEVLVLYRGRVVEQGPADALFATPRHPYTQALLAAVPEPDPDRVVAAGSPDVPADPEGDPAAPGSTPGCAFVARCPLADARCVRERPALVATGPAQLTACHHAQVRRPGSGSPR